MTTQGNLASHDETHNRLNSTTIRSAQRRDTASVEIGLTAAILSVLNNEPVVLVVRDDIEAADANDGLPYGAFSPIEHRTLEMGLRAWVIEQTGIDLGYVEQLYTFGDRGRHASPDDIAPHIVSIGYLALTRPLEDMSALEGGQWRSWYQYFPWEDWRRGRPEILSSVIEPALKSWASSPSLHRAPARPVDKNQRVRMCFGTDGAAWDEEKVLDRFELLFEAGLVKESHRDRPDQPERNDEIITRLGAPMRYDHRRILATAITRMRAKIKYRPVVFELMPDEFTLFELQKTVEAILGPHLHKQNFRRLVESTGLVIPTGEMRTRTGGRPAKLFRFRQEVLMERPAPGVRVKSSGRN